MTKEIINSIANEIFSEVVEHRRFFHKNPELSCNEKNTAAHICSVLDKWGIPYKSNIDGYGIVAIIEGKNKGKCVALRADMDALSIQEENDVEYKSCNAGVMHACGHDAHMASLLGTAYILKKQKNDFNGTFKLIFQPSEEALPGGALKMINSDVLENPHVDAIIAQHVIPNLHTGKVGFRSGAYMASTDEIYITVNGRGGHGATQELNIDPVVIIAQILIALQQISSRFAKPATPTVLSFGRMIADGQTNIIPDKATLEGTFRTFDEDWRKKAHKLIEDISKNTAAGFGATCDVKIKHGYPFIFNNEEITALAKTAATEFLGKENVVDMPIRMTADDFAYFLQKTPGIFYRLGTTNPETNQPSANQHTSKFDIDENALFTGMTYMSYLALTLLKNLNDKK